MSDLIHLSLRRCGNYRHTVPPPPSNEDRVRAYRAVAPVELANNHPWNFVRRDAYQRDAMNDARFGEFA